MIVKRPYPRTLVAALAILAMTVAGAAIAWACTPTANVAAHGGSGSPYGAPGSQVTARGSGFVSGAPVEIRWTNSIGATVRDLGTASGPSFAVDATIPSVPEGTYYIVATAPDTDGTTRHAAAGFVVGEPRSSSPPPDPAPNPGSDAPASGSPSSGSPAAGSNPEATTAPGPTSGTTNRGDTPGAGPRGDPGSVGERAPSGRGDDTPRSTERRLSGGGAPVDNSGGVTTLPSGQAVYADSLGARGPDAVADGPGAAAASKSAPSESSAGDDLWSGFSRDEPGIIGQAASPAAEPRSPLTWGMALGAFGLMVLMAGLSAAALRRRRSLAR